MHSAPPVEEQIALACSEASSSGIAGAIGAMVRQGKLAPGDQLPTVRGLARRLEVSSSTVSEAWRILNRHGVISTARRNGTVINTTRAEMSGRFWKVPAAAGSGIIDLSTGTPDTELLPPLRSMLQQLPDDIAISSYIDRPVLAELESMLHDRWPFPAEAMTVVDGALDALDRLITATVAFGDVVVVEDPTFPPILDMLERIGATSVGVRLDEHGVHAGELTAALKRHQPSLAILQPTAHNPTGISMTPERVAQVADAFRQHAADTWIIEDHHTGDLSGSPVLSIGSELPDRVVHVHSFSKSHGPDLRIAAVGGAAVPIAAVVDRRRLGPSWTSRLVQHMLLTMLTDPANDELVRQAAATYLERTQAITDGLGRLGIEVRQPEGLNVWIPVANEQRAVISLALAGIGVAPGTPFNVDASDPRNHIRVSIGNARGDLTDIIAAIGAAATTI